MSVERADVARLIPRISPSSTPRPRSSLMLSSCSGAHRTD